MDASRLWRAAAFVLREADADRSVSFDELKDYHLVPVAVMAELRAALAAPEPAPAQAGEDAETVLLMDVLDALVECTDSANTPRHENLAARVRVQVDRRIRSRAAPSRPGGAAQEQAGEAVAWHRVQDGDTVIAGGRKITMRVEPFRADPHPSRPGGAA